MPSLIDMMSPEDQDTVKRWAKARKESRYKRDIPYQLYLAAELGYYYGWQAVVDFRRGYQAGIDKNGKTVRLSFEYEDAVGLVEAAKKVHYRQMMDSGRVNASTIGSSFDKDYSKNNCDYVNRLAEEAYR